jgi:general nucleoside transport system permease protein
VSGTALRLPWWAEYVLLPLLNLLLALLAAGVVVVLTGQSPLEAVSTMVSGAFGSGEGIGYTLYYATDMVFTGLAVAVAFHCGLFNIGAEGQAYIAGLGVALVCLYLDFLPFWLILPLAIAGAALFGAAYAAIPGWLQAKRGSHIVITTIMANFIAYSLMEYLLVNVLIKPGQMSPETRYFAPNATLPKMDAILGAVGIEIAQTPLNLTFILALLCVVLVWVLIWHTRWGYALRVVGASPRAAVYAGIAPAGRIVQSMLLSGALAGGVALNEVMGAQGKLLINFPAGYGFTGIAVALMGRNHPFGVLIAAILFGALYQGGAELTFDMPAISPYLVVALQGLVILFTGGLATMLRPSLVRVLRVGAEAR